uniref:CP n=1 Tax=Plum bark necrosis stem pitting-associated virus TaxID=675077 RepID=A0A6G7MC77_9CLOS|nr:CP [Plum bark necrosis stem pitting-associated virus]
MATADRQRMPATTPIDEWTNTEFPNATFLKRKVANDLELDKLVVSKSITEEQKRLYTEARVKRSRLTLLSDDEKEAVRQVEASRTMPVLPATPSGVKNVVATMKAFMSNPSETAMFDWTKMKIPKMIDVRTPGVVTTEHSIEVYDALRLWALSKGLQDTDEDMASLVTTGFQNALSFSTVKTAAPAGHTGNKLVGSSKPDMELPHNEFKGVVESAIQSYGYENPLRQWMRKNSAAVIQMTSAGFLQPNIKKLNENGIPPQYYPFGGDFLVVDSRVFGYSAALASQLGRMVALNRKRNGNKEIHNLYEQTTAAPQIFTGGNQSGGR